jgi:hypothetical protein
MALTYGRPGYENHPAAYMLFYSKHARLELDRADVDPALAEIVAKEGGKMFRALLSPGGVQLMQAVQDTEILLRYFLNIFCHSNLSHLAEEFGKVVIQRLGENTWEILEANHEKIVTAFLNCCSHEILWALVTIIWAAGVKISPVKGAPLIDRILAAFPQSFAVWRAAVWFGWVILHFVSHGPDYLAVAIDNHWAEKVIDLLVQLFAQNTSDEFRANVDISPFLEFLGKVDGAPTERLSAIQTLIRRRRITL